MSDDAEIWRWTVILLQVDYRDGIPQTTMACVHRHAQVHAYIYILGSECAPFRERVLWLMAKGEEAMKSSDKGGSGTH